MKRFFVLISVVAFLAAGFGMAMAGDAAKDSPGPAPNSGDGVSDGSGLDSPNGPNAAGQGAGSVGPAPNSGDGVSDGSGDMDSPGGK